MTRIEDNTELIERIIKQTEKVAEGFYRDEEVMNYNLRLIVTVLADISKSLAIIAESETNNGNK